MIVMDDAFSNDVREFIGKHIHSVAQLEILLMLRSEPTRYWSADEITKKLYLQLQMTERLLLNMVQRGFAVQSDSGFRYHPANSSDRGAIDRLAQVYHERRVAVTAEIFSKPIDSLRAFSDAFRMRKEG
jgi:hypothetical protein